jgi:hypothetical protein
MFASGVTVGEIATANPEMHRRTPETRAQVDRLIERLGELLTRCREHSLSVLVPMGQEMSYRYQEELIVELLQALRQYRTKLES